PIARARYPAQRSIYPPRKEIMKKPTERQAMVGSYLLVVGVVFLIAASQQYLDPANRHFAYGWLSWLVVPWRLLAYRALDAFGVAHPGFFWWILLTLVGIAINAFIIWKLFKPWEYEGKGSTTPMDGSSYKDAQHDRNQIRSGGRLYLNVIRALLLAFPVF